MKLLKKILRLISYLIERFCTLLLFVMCMAIFVQVINRSLFRGAFFWSEPLAILCVIWITLLGSVAAAGCGTHTRVDFFVRKLPPLPQRMLESFNCLACAAFLVILTRYTLPMIESTKIYKVHGLEVFNKSVYYWPVLIGAALMVIYYIFQALGYWIDDGSGPDGGAVDDLDGRRGGGAA